MKRGREILLTLIAKEEKSRWNTEEIIFALSNANINIDTPISLPTTTISNDDITPGNDNIPTITPNGSGAINIGVKSSTSPTTSGFKNINGNGNTTSPPTQSGANNIRD